MERTVLEERDALSMERLASITKEHTAQEPFGDYFRKTASFVIKMDEVYRKIKDGKTESYTLEQWQAFNQSLYEDILPENYEHSYGNPKYAVEKLGEVHGRILSFLYAELYALIGYAIEQRQHEKGQKSPILHFFAIFSGLYVSYHSPEALRLKGHIPVSTNVEHPARTGKHVMTNFRNVMTNSGSRMWDFKPQNSIFVSPDRPKVRRP